MKSRAKIPIAIWVAIIAGIASIIAAFIGILPLIRSPEKLITSKEIISAEIKPITLNAPFLMSVYYYPSGWMGDGEQGKRYINLDTAFRGRHRPDDNDGVCIKISYQPGSKGWAGIYWQYPDGNWGEQPGRNIKGATKITFWASGDRGGEVVEFKAGGIKNFQKQHQDSFEVSLGSVSLINKWQEYEIDLSGQDLSNVIGGFAWVATSNANPKGLTFYIDNVRYE